jgi:hypothetical protein
MLKSHAIGVFLQDIKDHNCQTTVMFCLKGGACQITVSMASVNKHKIQQNKLGHYQLKTKLCCMKCKLLHEGPVR